MLQTRTIEPDTLGLLKSLMSKPYLNHYYLVGGTALALQLGHRFSIDLDLFTHVKIDRNLWVNQLKEDFEVEIEVDSPIFFITYINGVKVDFVNVPYQPTCPMLTTQGVRLLDIRDIAPMKLNAITQRGSKKDFYDIYFLFKKIRLDDMLTAYAEKFKIQNMFQVLKSLTYFGDAEEFSDPVVFDKKISWHKIKIVIAKTIDDYLTSTPSV